MASSYKFDIPTQSRSIIKVIGVGGGGSNAVNHMYSQGIKDVEFVVCNTDKQALLASEVPNKLQIGEDLTEGLGAGANPERGRQAALESREDIRELLSQGTKMVFITAGMGGGTGTGAAPVIAQVARELGILTVGIVTAPFVFEGRKKRDQADNGIEELRANCDTVLVILNDKVREIYGNLPIRSAFAKADNVLTTAAKSIAEIITVTSEVNVDFEDVKTVMKDSGAAVMGSAITDGENRAQRAAEESLSSPLLNNTEIRGAQKILLSIMSGDQAELEMDELTEITEYIQHKAGDEAEVIFGHGIDSTLGASIRVTVIATGFPRDGVAPRKLAPKQIEVFGAQVMAEDASSFSQLMGASAPQAAAPEAPAAPAPPVAEPSRAVFDIDHPAPEAEAVPVTPSRSGPPAEPTLVPRRPQTTEAARPGRAEEWRRRLRELSSAGGDLTGEDYKQLETPAYQRRNVALDATTPSAERKISRFSLTDDNEILGDNRFLHDNVD